MPLTEWLAGRLHGEVDEHLGAGGLGRRGLFRDGALARLAAEHRLRVGAITRGGCGRC